MTLSASYTLLITPDACANARSVTRTKRGQGIHGFTVVVLRISIFKILPRKKKKSAIVYLPNFGKENASISVNGNGHAVSLQ